MPWRRLHLVRAFSATGLLTSLMFLGSTIAPSLARGDFEPTTAPTDSTVTETVDILKAAQAGDLRVSARGQGQDKVRLSIQNESGKRLNVVIPPGLVASSGVAQGGRGFQSMGLGTVTNRPGSFGRFEGTGDSGLRSIAVTGDSGSSAVTIPAGETLDLSIPAVCLNFGAPTPTPRDSFSLVDVDDYTNDARIRKGLRSLALLGTSQGVAQASMWRICDDVPFEKMSAEGGKLLNDYEIALASRFVEAVDVSEGDALVDSSLLTEGRVFVRIEAEGDRFQADAERLASKLEGLRLFGLPIQVVLDEELPISKAPAVFVRVILSESSIGETIGRLQVGYSMIDDNWRPLGKTAFRDHSSLAVLDSLHLAQLVERQLVSSFVSIKPARRSVGSTTIQIDNRLPFTIAGLSVRAGDSAGSPIVPFEGVGIGPARSAQLPIQAANALIANVELNGL